MPQIILHLGSNVGLRNANLLLAKQLLRAELGRLKTASAVYETSAWGIENQRSFLNQALCFKTAYSPQDALKIVLEIETKMGRKRAQKWGERLIDIDLIFYDDQIIDAPQLQLPHPWMQERRFVLVPLAEIIPKWRHPILKKKVMTLLKSCTDTGTVVKVN